MAKLHRIFNSKLSRAQPFKLVVNLFHEGHTELRYLQDLVKDKKNLIKISSQKCVSDPVTLIKKAIDSVAKPSHFSVPAETWVIFDDDEKMEEVEVAGKLYKNWVAHAKTPEKLHIAYMKPCIELWAVLCVEEKFPQKDIKNRKNHKAVERYLEKIMPTYKHDGSPYFDLRKMTHYDSAFEHQRQWEQTFGKFPECCRATFYAGIAPLICKILDLKG